jgi:hypothetical protein
MKRQLGLVLVTVFALSAMEMSSYAWAEPAPQPSASAKLDMGFLLLPAVELEPVAPATDVNAKNNASPSAHTEYRVGDEIILKASQLAVPQGSTPPFKVDIPPGTPALNDEGWEIFPQADPSEFKLIAVPMKAGNLTLPSLAIQDSSGKSIARSNPFRIEVKSAIRPDDPKPQEPAELRPPAELAFPWWAVVLMAFAAAFVLGAILYSLYRWSQGRKAKPAEPIEPPKPEDEVALAGLAQLEKSGALEKGDFKKYYFGVSEILKTYIGRRYDFDAPENTTREMLENLKQVWAKDLSGNEKRLASLSELFEQLDRVKFTDYVPPLAESRGIVEVAREFVRATKRPPAIVTHSSSVASSAASGVAKGTTGPTSVSGVRGVGVTPGGGKNEIR